MKIFRKLLTCSVVLVLLASGLFAAEFEHEYYPKVLPTESSPQWRGGGNLQDVVVKNAPGKLKVSTTADKAFHYSMGILEDGNLAGEGLDGWDASSGTSTIDFRLRCEGEDPDAEVFILFVSDGERNWRVSFHPGLVRVSRGGDREIDASQADTYRIILTGDLLQLSSARHGILFKDVSAPKNVSRNRILFGNFPGEDAPTSRVEWELEFLRWTNSTADPEPPSLN